MKDITTKIRSGATPSGGESAYLPQRQRYALIRSQNVFDRYFDETGLAFISDEQASGLSGAEVMPGDLLINITGDGITFARSCLVPATVLPACVNQHVMIIRVNAQRCEPGYLLSYLTHPNVKPYIESFNAGGSRRAITKGHIESFEVPLPPLSTQRRIADILSALDDKIELNRQTNATLEAMAQAIFKEWFVDFNYSGATGELVDSELGLIPAGWRVGKLGEVANIKHGFAFKGEYFSEEETDDILLTPGNFRIGGGFNYSKFKYYEGTYPQEYVLKHGDLIVTMTDLSKQGDTLGFSALVPAISDKNLLHNQRIGKVEVTESNSWKLYLYWVMQQRDYRNYVLSGATGTTVKHTSPSRICDYKIILPPLKVLQAFKSTVRGLIDLVEDNHLQANTLEKVRDTLLPKLIRGEIEV